MIHGGDLFGYAERNPGRPVLDFSANLNPLGTPEAVVQAIRTAPLDRYPDPLCRALRRAMADKWDTEPETIFCGAGAADVIFRLALALKPKRAIVPAPTFAEYAAALRMTGCEVQSVSIGAEHERFDALIGAVTEDTDLICLCSPNNPTGLRITKAQFDAVYARARECGAVILLDECFGSLCTEPESLYTGQADVILLGSFTKSFAIPDVRLGFCRSENRALIEKLYACGQPWAVTGAAQAAGMAALNEEEFLARSRAYLAAQRKYLIANLRTLGYRVIDGQANFLLCQAGQNICKAAEQSGILLRSCANFDGLDDTWFRIAVRTQEENRILIRTLEGL